MEKEFLATTSRAQQGATHLEAQSLCERSLLPYHYTCTQRGRILIIHRSKVIPSRDLKGCVQPSYSPIPSALQSYREEVFFFLFKMYGCTCDTWKFPGQGMNTNHSYHLCHRCSNAGFLTHCSSLGIELMPLQLLEPLQLNS